MDKNMSDSHSSLARSIHSTSLREGGLTTINAGDNTKFDISDGVIVIIDHANIDDPIVSRVPFTGFVGLSVDDLLTTPSTLISLTVNGGGVVEVVQRQEPIDRTLLLSETLIASLVHASNVQIDVINAINLNGPSYDIPRAMADAFIFLHALNTGNNYSANSNDLTLAKSEGRFFSMGVNTFTDATSYLDPNVLELPEILGDVWIYTWRNGSGGFETSIPNFSIIPGSYDDDSGGASVPGGTVQNNKWTIHRIYRLQTITAIHFGQAVYNSLDDAMLARETEEFEENPALSIVPARCWLFVRGNCTDLSDSARARFLNAGRIGFPLR